MILVDSSVLIDVIEEQNIRWADWSQAQIIASRERDVLGINLLIYSEISRDFSAKSALDSFLSDLGLRIDPLSPEIAYLAATAHASYRQAGGLRGATLPDFFIGAHAAVKDYPLLTRDAARIRTYFPDVSLITPE
jgi:hypothetical protein